MIAWIICDGRRPYVTAVLTDRAAAEAYRRSLAGSPCQEARVEASDDLTLPCYLAEDDAGFRMFSGAEAEV